MHMSTLFVDYFRNRKEPSLLVNVGSIIEGSPTPGYNLYAAGKAFINFFTGALATELRWSKEIKGKIHVTTYSPGLVATKMNNWAAIPLFNIAPLEAANGAVADFGRFSKTNGTFT